MTYVDLAVAIVTQAIKDARRGDQKAHRWLAGSSSQWLFGAVADTDPEQLQRLVVSQVDR